MKLVKKILSLFLLVLIFTQIFVVVGDIFNTQYHTPSYQNSQLKKKYPQIEHYKAIFTENLPIALSEKMPLDNSIHQAKIHLLGLMDCEIEKHQFSMAILTKLVENNEEKFSKISMSFVEKDGHWLLTDSALHDFRKNPFDCNKLQFNTFQRILGLLAILVSITITIFTSLHCFYRQKNSRCLWLFLFWFFSLISWNFLKFNLTTETWDWCFSRKGFLWEKSSPYTPYFFFIKFPILEIVYWGKSIFIKRKNQTIKIIN